MNKSSLLSIVLRILLIYLLLAGIFYARPVLVPLAIGGILAMLFYPVCKWLESKKIPRGISVIICLFILAGSVGILIFLLSLQLNDFVNDAASIEKNILGFINNVTFYVEQTFGITLAQQKDFVNNNAKFITNASSYAATFLGSTLTFLVDVILVMAYFILLLFSRGKIKQFILMLVPDTQRKNTSEIIFESSTVAHKYLTGLSFMIAVLWVMYGIGFSIIGVKNALFFAVLCGILEIVPFVGNLTGTILTVTYSLSQGANLNLILLILIIYSLVQFIQTYFLEPLIVGSAENINPLFTIIALVVGEAVWGIPGMFLALPLVGILKIVFDHVGPLKPYGFLIGKSRRKLKKE